MAPPAVVVAGAGPPLAAASSPAATAPPTLAPLKVPAGLRWLDRARLRERHKAKQEITADLPADDRDAALRVATQMSEADDATVVRWAHAARTMCRDGDGPTIARNGRMAAVAARTLAQRGMDKDLAVFNPEFGRRNPIASWHLDPDRNGARYETGQAVFADYDARCWGLPCTIGCRLEDGTTYELFVDDGDGTGLRWRNPAPRPKPEAVPDDAYYDAAMLDDDTNTNPLWVDDRNQDREDRYSYVNNYERG
ncbi:MAG TPA: hypothetical protein VHD87_15615 [Acidimicrobiales bacterium]|nr:hypothetical protein [Acidimicrobiales bacterium]